MYALLLMSDSSSNFIEKSDQWHQHSIYLAAPNLQQRLKKNPKHVKKHPLCYNGTVVSSSTRI